MFAVLTMVHTADTMEQLGNNTKILTAAVSGTYKWDLWKENKSVAPKLILDIFVVPVYDNGVILLNERELHATGRRRNPKGHFGASEKGIFIPRFCGRFLARDRRRSGRYDRRALPAFP